MVSLSNHSVNNICLVGAATCYPAQHFTLDCDLLPEINNTNIFGFYVLRKERRLMTSLNTCQICSPDEDMQSFQSRCHLAYRARKGKKTH